MIFHYHLWTRVQTILNPFSDTYVCFPLFLPFPLQYKDTANAEKPNTTLLAPGSKEYNLKSQ